jgi:hypothetical protein
MLTQATRPRLAHWPLAVPREVRNAATRQSRPRSPGWRYFWESAKFTAIALLTAVAVLLLLERVLFDTPALAARLPVGGDSPQDKLLLAARYPDTQVLYLGDSRVRTDIHPGIVSQTCACGPGFNAGFGAADLRLTSIMSDRLLQKLSPELVVISVSQWELSDGARIEVWGPARELMPPWQLRSFGVSLDEPQDVRDAIGSFWRLYKHRAKLRAAVDPGASAPRPDDTRRGFTPDRRTRQVGDDDLERVRQRFFANVSVEGNRTQALRSLIANLRQRGIQVLLVAPPLYSKLYDRVPDEVALFRSAMEQIAAENSVAFEDATDPRPIGLKAGNFRDGIHLDQAGASTFSRHLGNVIGSRFGTP